MLHVLRLSVSLSGGPLETLLEHLVTKDRIEESVHHLGNKPDSRHVLECIHTGRQALLSGVNNRLVGGTHLVDMHDERREERIDAGDKISMRYAEGQANCLHEGWCKPKLVVLGQSLDDRSDHTGCLVCDVLGWIGHVFREAIGSVHLW